MKLIAPDDYGGFRCIAGECRHTCCAGWEVDIDAESAARYRTDPEIAPYMDETGTPHFRLTAEERCPFLRTDGLCKLIAQRGEDILCQTCRDHPRFRNFWTDRTEIGLGFVCEAAATLPEDEAWLMELREQLWAGISETGPRARLLEYLIYRHLPDALYDGRVEERIAFISRSFREITARWEQTDGSIEALAEVARAWSYDVEYDDEELEKRLCAAAPDKE